MIRRVLGRILTRVFGRTRTEYHDEELRVRDLLRGRGPRGAFTDATFTGCLIEGPAILVIGDGFALIQNVIEGGADAFLWPVEEGRHRVIGAVPAARCEFRGCTFRSVGFAAPAPVIERIRATIDEQVGGWG